MIVVEKIMMQRRDPNGLQKEYHKSDRIATAMCDAAGFDAEYAGMAVHRADARVKAKNAGASGTHFYGLDTARYLCVIHSYRLAIGIPHKLADLLREVRAAAASQAFRSGLPDCPRQ